MRTAGGRHAGGGESRLTRQSRVRCAHYTVFARPVHKNGVRHQPHFGRKFIPSARRAPVAYSPQPLQPEARGQIEMSRTKTDGEIPRRLLGRTGARVSALALGGYHLGMAKTKREAVRIVHEAIDAGLDFMDNAWEYHEGKSEEWMGAALAGRRDRVFLMTKV